MQWSKDFSLFFIRKQVEKLNKKFVSATYTLISKVFISIHEFWVGTRKARQKFSLLNINSVPDSVCEMHCFPRAVAKAVGPHRKTPTFELKEGRGKILVINAQQVYRKPLPLLLFTTLYVPWVLGGNGTELIVPVGFTIPSLLLKSCDGIVLRLILNSKMGRL